MKRSRDGQLRFGEHIAIEVVVAVGPPDEVGRPGHEDGRDGGAVMGFAPDGGINSLFRRHICPLCHDVTVLQRSRTIASIIRPAGLRIHAFFLGRCERGGRDDGMAAVDQDETKGWGHRRPCVSMRSDPADRRARPGTLIGPLFLTALRENSFWRAGDSSGRIAPHWNIGG